MARLIDMRAGAQRNVGVWVALFAGALACGASTSPTPAKSHYDWPSLCARGAQRLLRCGRIKPDTEDLTRRACESLSCVTSEYRPEALAAFVACETDGPCPVADCAAMVGATLPTLPGEAAFFERKRAAAACDTHWDLPMRGEDAPTAETHMFTEAHWREQTACMSLTDCTAMVTCLRADSERELGRLTTGCR
jgi:hypothetical protein